MFVIVEYLETGITRTINPREKVVIKPKPFVEYWSGVYKSRPLDSWDVRLCNDLTSWKSSSKHAQKNWMRHPKRIQDTGGSRTLNERGMCRHSLFLLPGD